MNYVLISIFCIFSVNSQVTLRLNTKQTTTLQVDQSITSTLGLFQATLRKTNCSLQIFAFNTTSYVSKGFYTSSSVTKDCSYLQIQQGKLITSQLENFMQVGSSFNDSTIFTIDDLGVIRLIGTYINFDVSSQTSVQTNVTNFLTPNKYIYTGAQLTVGFADSFGPITNKMGWGYQATFGQFDMYLSTNKAISKSYSYPPFQIINSQIRDFVRNTFPATLFPNITFSPRCKQPRTYINFKAPFIIMVDPYWPKLTVMEQGGYKILEQVYSAKSQYFYQGESREINHIKNFGPCPDQLFQHQGTCVTTCPVPYFHEMRGNKGSCRLVCEQFTPTDKVNRVCTCMDESPFYNRQFIKSCPNNTAAYPYGCYCTGSGLYFDRKTSLACVSNCPATTYAYAGLCVDCASNCVTCKLDGFNRLLLECSQCASGYTLTDGQCFKSCNTNLGYSLINNVCTACVDVNCVNCTTGANICVKCGLLYSLYNNGCVALCPNGTQLVASQHFESKCLAQSASNCLNYIASYYKSLAYLKCNQCLNNQISHLDQCISSCPNGYYQYNYQGFKYCACQTGLTIHDMCVNRTACPIKMYWDVYSNSCLSCSFACVTCKGSTCTSCYHGYFLYVSPQGIICRRNSPLFGCENQYGLINGACVVSDYQNLQMTLCKATIPNCQVCPYSQSNTCVMCMPDFLLYNNTCLSSCPSGLIPYRNVSCIPTQIPNCLNPFLISKRQSSMINISLITNNNAYLYYITTGNIQEPGNDPIGYIPYFQQIINRRGAEVLMRENSFAEVYWTCLKCNDGYGLTSNFSMCLPCPNNCVTCYMATNNSCITVPSSNNGKCQGYIDFATKACLKSCNSGTSFPQMQNNILYCKSAASSSVNDVSRIDSAIYSQGDGRKIGYFVFQTPIQNKADITIELKQSSSVTLSSQNRLVSASRLEKVPLIDGKYFQVISSSLQDIFIANFTSSISSLKSISETFPPNLVYGSTAATTHPEFMKTWLAVVGQIMAVVIIAMHCVYVGNQIMYKMDNLIILVQTIYYFSFVKILVGKLLAQFYYGWIFAHLGFFPNFFATPDLYRQNAAPISYKLATTDANFIRNAGYSLSILIVFIGAWILVTGILYFIYKKFHRKQLWYPQVAKGSLLAGIELISMNIIYWAVAHLIYRGNCQNCDSNYNNVSLVFSILFMALISIYTILRVLFNPIGGLYMLKRVLISIILPFAFDDLAFIAPLVIVQIIFVVFRFILQSPQLFKQKFSIIIQFIGILTCYLLMFICTNAQVNTIIISFVVFFFIVWLMYDYMTLYLQYVNQWEMESYNKVDQAKGNVKAKTQPQISRFSRKN